MMNEEINKSSSSSSVTERLIIELLLHGRNDDELKKENLPSLISPRKNAPNRTQAPNIIKHKSDKWTAIATAFESDSSVKTFNAFKKKTPKKR